MTNIKDAAAALNVFEQAAITHAAATQQGDYKTANKSYTSIAKAVNFLKEHNELKALARLLDHDAAGVRSWAATYLLPISETEAVKALEELVRRDDIHALQAEIILSEWRKGNLKGD